MKNLRNILLTTALICSTPIDSEAGPRHPRLDTMKWYVSWLVDTSTLNTKEDIIKIINTLNNPKDSEYTILDTIDGDTVVIYYYDEFITCRLIWVDTPETKDPRKEVQFYWPEASNFCKKTLKWEKVKLEFERYPDWSIKRDNKERLLVYIFLKDWTFFNLEVIKKWFAREYTYREQSYKHQKELKNAQETPQKQCLWLWEKECLKNMNE